MISFTVSARNKPNSVSMQDWLVRFTKIVGEGHIRSVFGFSTYSPLYGGRNFKEVEVTEEDLKYLSDNNIGFRIPLSNSFFTEYDYEKTKPLLEKHHNKINSIICTNDELALRIRQDYPKYTIEASAIKNIKFSEIDKKLEVYDSLVLPMYANDDIDGLDSIKIKEKVVLFANAGCAYKCPSKICYPQVSKMNNGSYKDGTVACIRDIKPIEGNGMVFFDLDKLKKLGFTKFKLLPM
jgi:hypothetical protein